MRLALWVSIVGQLTLAPVLFGQQKRSDPDVTARGVAEVLLGGVGAVLGAYMGASIVGGQDGEEAALRGLFIGAMVGAPVGAATGAYLGGRAVHAGPNFVHALAGAGLGMAGFLLVQPVAGLEPDQGSFWVCFFGMPVAGAVLFEEIGIRNRRVQLQLVPRKEGLMLGARVSF